MATDEHPRRRHVAPTAETAGVERRYRPGTPVEVHNRYTDGWSRGFAVAELSSDGYRLRRLSDGATLPVVFVPDEIRQSTGVS